MCVFLTKSLFYHELMLVLFSPVGRVLPGVLFSTSDWMWHQNRPGRLLLDCRPSHSMGRCLP